MRKDYMSHSRQHPYLQTEYIYSKSIQLLSSYLPHCKGPSPQDSQPLFTQYNLVD